MREVVAGVSLALSGPLRLQGEQALDGLRLWVAWVTDHGGLPVGPGGTRRPPRLVVLDDGGRLDVVRENVRRLLDANRVDLLIGPYSSGLTRAVVPLAAARGKLLWNPSQTGFRRRALHRRCPP